MAVTASDDQLRITRSDSGWPPMWKHMMRELGVYGKHYLQDDQFKKNLVNQELAKYGGAHLVAVSIVEAVIQFPDHALLVQFQLTWS